MSTAGIPVRMIGSPGAAPGDSAASGGGEFAYAFVSPPQPGLHTLEFNFSADLGVLNTSTPAVTFSTSADIRRFVRYGQRIIWYHGLSDRAPPVLGMIRYYQQMTQQFGGLERPRTSRAPTRSRTWPLQGRTGDR